MKNINNIANNPQPYYFKELLKIAIKYNIDSLDLSIACQVNFFFENLNDYDFEKACELIKDTYLKTDDLTIPLLALSLKNLIKIDKLKLKDITKQNLIDRYI